MPNTKLGGNRWVPDIRSDNITEFEDGTENYKSVDAHPILNKLLDAKAFFRTHAKAVWYSLQDRKTVYDIISEQENRISSLEGRFFKMYVSRSEEGITLAPPSGAYGIILVLGNGNESYALFALREIDNYPVRALINEKDNYRLTEKEPRTNPKTFALTHGFGASIYFTALVLSNAPF